MTLFGNKKNKEKNTPCCCGNSEETEASNACCGNSENTVEQCCCGETTNIIHNIKVLGAGCKSCHQQYENVKKSVSEMGLDIKAEYITDMEKVMIYGVISMPAIVVNEKIVSAGRVLKSADVEKLLRKLGFNKYDN